MEQVFEVLVDRVGSFLGALGVFLVAGVIVAALGTWIFSELAERVMAGGTQAFTWGTEAGGWSFPSGHAMSATIAYSTVAYLAARLHRRRWARWLTMSVAMLLILVICGSRVYLGVHYPSDVLAGIIIGLAWAAFCMATLEGIQRFSEHRAPRVKKDEAPAPAATKS